MLQPTAAFPPQPVLEQCAQTFTHLPCLVWNRPHDLVDVRWSDLHKSPDIPKCGHNYESFVSITLGDNCL